MKLNLGSGYEPTAGFVNVDLSPNAPGVDHVGPIYPLDFPDASVDEIRATNCLEHLPYRQSAAALADWARVLVPGGRMFLQVPDAGEIMRWYVQEPALLIERLPADVLALGCGPALGAAWRLLGGQDDGEHAKDGDDPMLNAHLALFTSGYLTALLDAAGFDIESMETNVHPNLLVWCVKR